MGTEITPTPIIPTETSRAARLAFQDQHIYLRIGDHLAMFHDGINLALLDPSSNMSGDTIFRLALATAFQSAETMPDPLAAEATRKRLDWKYALYLPAWHPGISSTALCAFREGLFSSFQGMKEFGIFLKHLHVFGLFCQSTGSPLDPFKTLTVLCQINRLHLLHHSIKTVLGMLVSTSPDWLAHHVSPYWYQRYQTGQLAPQSYQSLEDMRDEIVKLRTDLQHLLAVLDDDRAGLSSQDEFQKIVRLLNKELTTGDSDRWHLPNCTACACRSPGFSFG